MLRRVTVSAVCVPVTLALTVLGSGASGTQPSATRPPSGTAEAPFPDVVEVELVDLSVVVTDRRGRPVSGLTVDDFEVLEDGRPVEISHFAAYGTERPGAERAAAPAMSPETAVAEVEAPPGPVSLIVYVDNQHLRRHTRELVFRRLRAFVEGGLESEDRVMVVTASNRLQVRLPFTRDREALLKLLDEIEQDEGLGDHEDRELRLLLHEITYRYRGDRAAAAELRRIDFMWKRYQGTVRAQGQRSFRMLAEFVRSLAELPGRKTLLHVSDGLTMNPESQALWRLVAHANADRIAIHSIDGGGSRQFDPEEATLHAAVRDLWNSEVARARVEARERVLRNLAARTGGRYLREGEGLVEELATVRRSLDVYYSLAFEPRESGDRVRLLEVRVGREGLRVQAPRSYRLKSVGERLEDRVLAALHLGRGTNSLGLRLEVGEPSPAETKDRLLLPVTLHVPLADLLVEERGAVHEGGFSVIFAVQSPDGRLSDLHRKHLPVKIPDDQLVAARRSAVRYQVTLMVRPERQWVAFAVRDDRSPTVSTLVEGLDLSSEAPGISDGP